MELYLTNGFYKEHIIMETVKSKVFEGMQNDQVKKEITCAMISVPFISWFTCADIGSFGVVTNGIRTAIVGFSFTLVDV